MVALPLLTPGAKATDTGPVAVVVDPDVARTAVGAAGDPTTTDADGADAGPVPRALVAVTAHA